MKQAPCRSCKKRELHCHSTCEDYIAFSNYRKSILKEKQKLALEYECKKESILRMQKVSRRKKKEI